MTTKKPTTKATTMDAQDWIILRLLTLMARNQPHLLVGNADTVQTVLYLSKKYPTKYFQECCATLRKETRRA